MMLTRFLLHVLTAVALLAPVAKCPAGTQPIVTSDLLRIREVTAIDVANDGSRTVYAVKSMREEPASSSADITASADARPKYSYQSHLFLLDLTSPDAQPRQLTAGDRFDASPRFSPDGRRIAFVRSPSRTQARPDENDDAADASQVWVMPVDGGEAWPLSDFSDGCAEPRWSPDGRRIIVSAQVAMDDLPGSPAWPVERPRRAWNDVNLPPGQMPSPDGTRQQIRAWLEDNASHADPIVITRQDFQGELALLEEMKFRHVFILDVAEGDAIGPPVTLDRARRVTSGFADHDDHAFTADGTAVLYSAKKPVDRHPDRVLAHDLWMVNVDGSNDRRILALDGWSLTTPKPSRDGAVIGFLGTRTDEPAFRQTQLGMASLKGEAASDPVWLTDDSNLPASVDAFEWQGLQPGMLFTAAMRGGFPLLNVSPSLLQPATLVGEENGLAVGVHAFAAGGGAIVCSVTSAANPCVLKVRDGRGVRLAHDLNPWVKDKNIILPVMGQVTRPDGLTIDYWLMEPTDREVGRKYPMCLNMHGGPSAMWGPGEATMWHEFQLLCSRGFGVVYGNPRGSGGYGYAFQRGNFQNWGEGPAGDVLAIVDHALMKDWADADRLVITGGSYAGYLTAWIIAHDHRFKAAVAQRGVYDLDTFFGEGNAWRLVQYAFGGNPFENRMRDIIARNNPFTHVAKIRTPLLILHSSNDLRTGVSQSEMLYRALKELNRDVEYVRYPDSGHDLSRTGDPRQRMDRLNRIIEFFERFIDNPRDAPAPR